MVELHRGPPPSGLHPHHLLPDDLRRQNRRDLAHNVVDEEERILRVFLKSRGGFARGSALRPTRHS